ncbi:WhiB family transcriptional regulator [Streptomyces sp. NPDC051018]|uniref:WhiB family transcriptional regulator n=1 Tax=Streptomyces sp. NPDC051018 TaxID=3365639 RepID=UPI00378D87E9
MGPVPRRRAPGPDGPDTMEWQREAACTDEDPELFFPISAIGPGAGQLDRAREVCGRCPVSRECFDWALSTGQRTGVWGGTAASQRRSVGSSVRTGGGVRPSAGAAEETGEKR